MRCWWPPSHYGRVLAFRWRLRGVRVPLILLSNGLSLSRIYGWISCVKSDRHSISYTDLLSSGWRTFDVCGGGVLFFILQAANHSESGSRVRITGIFMPQVPLMLLSNGLSLSRISLCGDYDVQSNPCSYSHWCKTLWLTLQSIIGRRSCYLNMGFPSRWTNHFCG